MVKKSLFLVLAAVWAVSGFAGGEMQESSRRSVRVTNPEAAELIQHTQAVTKALEISRAEALEACMRVRTKYDRLTVAVAPAQDAYGDPMYAFYGPRAYAGSPMYNGPAYVASFERNEGVIVPEGTYRGYYRQSFSHPTMYRSSDVGTLPGATHSYIQSGMLYSPGSQAPQHDRPMMFNHQLAF